MCTASECDTYRAGEHQTGQGVRLYDLRPKLAARGRAGSVWQRPTAAEAGMRVLVTGGAGFIGSHLVERLLEQGNQVTVLDDLSSGSLRNLAAVRQAPRLTIRRGAVQDPAALVPLVDGADAVVHLAAAVGVRKVMEQTVATVETNVGATQAVLHAASRQRTRTLLASSSEVYGRAERLPSCEDDPLVLGATSSPRWSYACAKALDEWLALAFFREQGLPVTVMRFFNTVGPRQSAQYGMVLPRLVGQALRRDPLTVYGDGEQTRCFAHVRDTVEAIVRLLGCESSVGEVVNVGSNQELSILALARRIQAITRTASPIDFRPLHAVYGPRFEEPVRRVPDLRKLARLTGFVPQISIDEIISDLVTALTSTTPRDEAPTALAV